MDWAALINIVVSVITVYLYMIAVDTVIFMIVNNMVTIFVAWVNNCFDSLVLVFHYTWVVHYMVSYFVHCSYAYPFIEDVDMRGSR